MRTKVTLACIICQSRNYVVDKNKQITPQRLERRKFCRVCNKHTLHKETR